MAKPEIRLKGFKGEWKIDSFANTFRFLKNNSLSRADLNYENGKVKNVHYGDVLIKFGELLDVSQSKLPFITNNKYADSKDKELFLQNGDVVFADAAEDNAVGKCSEIQGLGLADKVVSGLHTIPCRPIRQFEKGYLGYFLNSNSYHDQLLPMIQGTKVCGISKGNLNLTTISYPNNKEEQVALADYFKSLDSMILATKKKIASLNQMKQACLVSMFPQAGETTPRVRFKGFKGEWIKVTMGDVFVERHEISTITNELPQLSFTIEEGVIRPEDRKSNKRDFLIKDKSNKKYLVTYVDDIIYNPANVIYGAIHKNGLCNGVVSPIYKIFFTEQDPSFMECVVRKPEFIQGMTVYMEGTVQKLKTLKPEAFLQMSSIIAPSVEEQRFIGRFFKSLDKQISLQEQRLEKLKQIKASCLDKMFV